MYTQAELFAKALFIEKPWFVNKIEVEQSKGRLDILINFGRGTIFFMRIKVWVHMYVVATKQKIIHPKKGKF